MLIIGLATGVCEALDTQDVLHEKGKKLELAGWESFEVNQLAQAEKYFQQSVEAGNPEGHRGLSEVYFRQNQLDRTEHHLLALLEVNPNDKLAKERLAGILAAIPDRRDDAAKLYDELLDEEPDNIGIMIEKANVLAWSGQYTEAELLFEKILLLDLSEDTRRKAEIGIANTLAWSGRHKQAVEHYHRLLTDERDAETLRGLGDVEWWHGRAGHAAPLYREALSLQDAPVGTKQSLKLAEDAIGPWLYIEGQYFTDSANWQRWKALTTINLWLHESGTLAIGTEAAHYRDNTGDVAQRLSAVARYTWLFDTFAKLEADMAIGGATGGDTTITGGAGVTANVTDRIELYGSYRHEDVIDDISAFAYRPSNSASTVQLLEKDVLESDKLRGGGVWKLATDLEALMDVSYTRIEDKNNRVELFSGLEYQVYEDDTGRMKLRTWYFRSDFSRNSSLYFSPSNLESYGIAARLESETTTTQAFLEGGIFYQPSGINDIGYLISTGFDWEVTETLNVGFRFDHLSTAERSVNRYRSYGSRFYLTLDF